MRRELIQRIKSSQNLLAYFTKIKLFIVMLMTITSQSCQPTNEANNGYTPDLSLPESKRMTPELLWQLGRIGDESVSPDQTKVLFSVTYYKIDEDKGYRDLYVYCIEQGTTKRITDTAENENSAAWRPDGEKIGFISSKSGSNQLWEIDPDGKNRRQVTFIDGGIDGFRYSPCCTKMLFAKSVKLDQTVNDRHPDLPKANARLEGDLMYRHWDQWHDYHYNHLFLADYNEKGIFEHSDLMPENV
jgi:Tol biopolymer transport system component